MNKCLGFFVVIIVVLVGCSSGDPVKPPVGIEHDPPTTVVMQLIRLDSLGKAVDTTVCTVRDTSVIKGKLQVEGILSIFSKSTYVGSLQLLDESQSPAKNVTNIIVGEKDAHIFRFSVKGDNPNVVVISNLDKDSKGLDFGLNFNVTSISLKVTNLTGVINVILEHHDDGNKAGATFDTDINQNFPFVMK